jgi:hypothetical protein
MRHPILELVVYLDGIGDERLREQGGEREMAIAG